MAPHDGFGAELQATQVLRKLEITSLPVDPFAIATRHEIVCEQKPGMAAGISGCLMKVGDIFGILYSARFSSEGFRKFTVAHELGHYFLEGHVQHLFGAGQWSERSHSGSSDAERMTNEPPTATSDYHALQIFRVAIGDEHRERIKRQITESWPRTRLRLIRRQSRIQH